MGTGATLTLSVHLHTESDALRVYTLTFAETYTSLELTVHLSELM